MTARKVQLAQDLLARLEQTECKVQLAAVVQQERKEQQVQALLAQQEATAYKAQLDREVKEQLAQ